jgi:hypothetical protein
VLSVRYELDFHIPEGDILQLKGRTKEKAYYIYISLQLGFIPVAVVQH